MNMDNYIKYILLAFFINLIFTYILIKVLSKLNLVQKIREDVPQQYEKKANTPTMGGLGILLISIALTLTFIPLSPTIIALITTLVGFSLIGLIDDIYNIKKGKGMKARYKLLLQFIIATLIIYYLTKVTNHPTYILLPIIQQKVDLHYLYLPFVVLLIVFLSNAVNLTDGLDGLATGCIIIATLCFIYFTQNEAALTTLSFFIIGSCLAFLWFNFYKAKVFMGNCASLSLGALIALIAVLTKKELYLLIIGGIFVIEALSVIIQVVYFKLTAGKRVFRMAPLHHHFELCGIEEAKITVCFFIAGSILGLIGIII